MATEVVNRQRRIRIDRKRIAQLADGALEAAGRGAASVTVAFVSDRVIRRLNRDYRSKDRSTDVLSFPAGKDLRTGEGAGYLGDVVISADTAAAQATESGLSLEREVSELVIHGILHLCGYDHETDRGEMNRMELKLRRILLD